MTHATGPAHECRRPDPPMRRGLTVSFRAAGSKFFLTVLLLLSGSLAAVSGLICPC
jgi:hypothetical protein